MRIIGFMLLAVLLVYAGVDFAAERSGRDTVVVQRGGYSYGDIYGGGHASTAGEGYLRGMGDVVRSAGEYNLQTSQAAINLTEAQANYIRNREDATNTYFQMREANRLYRAQERGKRPTAEDLVRFAQAGRPKRPSPSELDTITGDVEWPTLLASDSFAKDRAQLEKLFAERATNGGISWEGRQKVKQATDNMLADLKKMVKDVPQMDYIASKRFVQSLAHEAGQRPG